MARRPFGAAFRNSQVGVTSPRPREESVSPRNRNRVADYLGYFPSVHSTPRRRKWRGPSVRTRPNRQRWRSVARLRSAYDHRSSLVSSWRRRRRRQNHARAAIHLPGGGHDSSPRSEDGTVATSSWPKKCIYSALEFSRQEERGGGGAKGGPYASLDRPSDVRDRDKRGPSPRSRFAVVSSPPSERAWGRGHYGASPGGKKLPSAQGEAHFPCRCNGEAGGRSTPRSLDQRGNLGGNMKQ